MSVVSVTERFQERWSRDNDDGTTEYRRSFMVQTDNANDGPETVKLAPGIPRRMQSYVSGNDSNPYARCLNVEATPVDGTRILWMVQAEYSTKALTTGQTEENPLNRPPVVRWGATFLAKPAIKGYLVNFTTGAVETTLTGIVNSAQDPFDPPAEMDDARLTLNITKNFSTYDPLRAYDYVNTINSDLWLMAQPRQWKCQNISATSHVETVSGLPFLYWQHEYEFHFRYETWELALLDQGFTYISGSDRIEVKDKNDQPKADPTNLNGLGALQTVGSAPVFRTYRVYREKPFLQLGLT